MKQHFSSAKAVHQFAFEKGVPFTGLHDLTAMNARMLTGLRIRKCWIIGMQTRQKQSVDSDHWNKIDREFITIDSFRLEHNELIERKDVMITGFYCYQLSNNPEQVIHLESLKSCPLDTQLKHFTGEGFSMIAFQDEDDENSLTPGGVIVHRETKQRFFVPPAPLLALD